MPYRTETNARKPNNNQVKPHDGLMLYAIYGCYPQDLLLMA